MLRTRLSETILSVPSGEPAKSKRDWRIRLTWKKVAVGILVVALVVLAVCFRHTPKKLATGIAEGFGGIVVIGGIGLVIYTVSVQKLWLRFFSILLFCSGSVLLLSGVAIFLAMFTKESTVFQEYEAIFLSLGGLVIISLSLILAALIELVNRKLKG